MTKDEALKLALEALNLNATMSIMEWHNQRNEAITAIKQALAAPVQDEQQPVQEPVAWAIWLHGLIDLFLHKQFAELEFERRNKQYPDKDRKLRPLVFCDTTPPVVQRQWQGLTQQDIDIAFDDTREGGGFDDFARAIEAVLKEKNT